MLYRDRNTEPKCSGKHSGKEKLPIFKLIGIVKQNIKNLLLKNLYLKLHFIFGLQCNDSNGRKLIQITFEIWIKII